MNFSGAYAEIILAKSQFHGHFSLFQLAGKRDAEQEAQAQQWIEALIGERFPQVPYEHALRDGIILCKLMNRLAPGIIPKINVTGGDYKMMDNLNQYGLIIAFLLIANLEK